MEELVRFDKFKLSWGENLDNWSINVVYKNEMCKFLWFYRSGNSNEHCMVRGNVKCFDVKLGDVQSVYNKLKEILPIEIWPSLIPR
jgi:hypothetical protein